MIDGGWRMDGRGWLMVERISRLRAALEYSGKLPQAGLIIVAILQRTIRWV